MTTSRRGIVLVLDPDEAGQRAAETSGHKLLQLFGDWGEPRFPREPTSHAVAHVQRAIDDLGEEIKALEALGVGGERLAQTEDMRWLLWSYMEELMRREKITAYSRANTAEEFEYAVAIEEAPLPPISGRIDFAAIKRDVDIVEFIERYTVLRRSGRTLRGPCTFPDHMEKTPSLYVYPDTDSFYCFGCNRGGDVIEYARLQGVSARDIT